MKIVDLSVKRKVTIAMVTLAALIFGIVSLSRLSVNLLPELTYPTLTISTEYEGAAPSEVENLVTKPIEEVVGAVKRVRTVRSISRAGQSDVILEFGWGTKIELASMEVREKLDAIRLPEEVKRPVILRFDPSMEAVMRYGLAFKKDSTLTSQIDPQIELKQLRRMAEDIVKKNLESSEGVASVVINGGFEEEIQILVDEKKLADLNLSISTIIQSLQRENVNLSGGKIESGSQELIIRTLNEFSSIEDIRSLIITTINGRSIYLRDVAMLVEGVKERESITRLNGVEAVEIAIYKEGDANSVDVSEVVLQKMPLIQKQLPSKSSLTLLYNQATFIQQAVDEVVDAGIVGGLLAIIILYLFLRDLWSTIIISLSIPISVIATFNLMYGNSISLNIMSLGGLALGIGMLVDNSIVVLESISKYREKGFSGYEAARKGASEVGGAVFASTLTTIAVFLPLVFVEGIAGQLFRDQALTVTFSLLASLVVAITLIPMLSSIERNSSKEADQSEKDPSERSKVGAMSHGIVHFIFTTIPTWIAIAIVWVLRTLGKGILWILNPFLNAFDRSFKWLENGYPTFLKWTLNYRFVVLLFAFLLFGGSLMLIPQLGIELIPNLSQGELRLEVKLPPGSTLETTDVVLERVSKAVNQMDEVKTNFSVVGSGNKMQSDPSKVGDHRGELALSIEGENLSAAEEQVLNELRMELGSIPGITYEFSRPSLFSFSTPIEVFVEGYNLPTIKAISDKLLAQLSASDRFSDIKSTMQQGRPELTIEFDRAKIAANGLSALAIANDVVTKVQGEVATKFSRKDRKIDISVKARENDRSTLKEIEQLIINPESEKPIPLSAIATIRVNEGPADIRRISQQRVGVLTANLAYGSLGDAALEVESMINTIPLPDGVAIRLGGQNEEMDASFQSLLIALSLAVFLVYLVMASQFESLIQPIIILVTVPLALIGSILALWITNSTVSVVVFIGLILLVGIVVNNAIVLIDYINKLRESGMEKVEAIAEAGRARLRPIMITMLTTTLGLLPLSLGVGEGAEIRAPMGITVIGGLLVSTLLTLVVLPTMYSLIDRKRFEVNSECSPSASDELKISVEGI